MNAAGPRVLVSTSTFGRVSRRPLELLEAAGVRYRLNPHGRKLTPEESAELLADADGVIAGTETLSREVLGRAPRLKVISRVGTGLDGVDLAAAGELGIRVAHTPDAHVDAVAELALGGMLAVLRHLAAADRGVRAGGWHKPMGSLLAGKTVGIVGLGRIGKALLRLLTPFGGTRLACDPRPEAELAGHGGVRYVGLDELLAESDLVTLHAAPAPAPGGDGGGPLLDRRRLARMKPGAVLINTARGGLVDETALAEAIAAGRLAGAHLDVFAEEPYHGPLSGLDNVLLTPHIGSYAAECRLRMEVEAVENLLAGLAAAGGGETP